MKEAPRGDVYKAVAHVYQSSPGRSWTRLNGALSETLSAAITAHLSVLPDDFVAICNDFNGGYWMGDGAGSHLGERFYTLAVKCGHTPACISFEKWAGRPAALWCESVKTPERLRDGSDFTWEGLRVSVTSMKTDHLIACTYKREENYGRDTLKEGHLDYIDGHYREVEYLKRDGDGRLLVRFGKTQNHETRTIARRFTIPYAAITERRRESDALRRAALRDISKTENPVGLSAIAARLSSALRGVYRHFDIEDFRKAIEAKRKEFSAAENEAQRKIDENRYYAEQAEKLERWAAGEKISGYWREVRLRINGDVVETSTGQTATLSGVKEILPAVIRHRHKRGSVLGRKLDMHDIGVFSNSGVQVGCTLIPWVEIDGIAKTLGVKC